MDNVESKIRADIVGFLEQNAGASFTLASISSKTRLGLASVRYTMMDLEVQGVVRRVSGERTARFYIPTAAQLAAMQKPIKAWPVLKPRPLHAALIASLRAAREAIPSKY